MTPATKKKTAATEGRKDVGKRYSIDVRQITENHNPRNPLGPELQKAGYSLFTGEPKDLWRIGTSGAAGAVNYCEVIDKYDPEFSCWATTFLTVGQVQAIEVRDNGAKSDKGNTYTLVVGARRCMAILYNWCKLGCQGTPWIEAQLSPKVNKTGLLHRSIVADTHKPPNPMERANAIAMLRNQGMEISEIAEKYGSSESWVKQKLALLELPIEIQKKIANKTLKPTKALQEHREANGTTKSGKPSKRTEKIPKSIIKVLEPLLNFKEDDLNGYMSLTIHKDNVATIYKLLGKKLETKESDNV